MIAKVFGQGHLRRGSGATSKATSSDVSGIQALLAALEESDSASARFLNTGYSQDLPRRALSSLDLHSGHTTSCENLRSHLALVWSYVVD